ncbi:NmrA-like family protein [Lasiodiplodia theobromae]|uniref:NmrA-like family protein n=1 Tax=Lasiodiplodia theobromae TaxID=45133 RepID=UPI0015C35D17|nr:NmrA-like family protein [Lasiodiplodia theobromae]KAF4545189.1 NmrA-like family protein [Lasiodiplodia theobromae]
MSYSTPHSIPEVNVIRVDFSFDSLKAAFTGKDAVISLLGHHAFDAQKTVIEAAIAAGVKRFIPSEFGVDTSNPEVVSQVPFVVGKKQVVDYLRSREDAISWTAVLTGIFFDWGLWQGWLGFDLGKKKVKLWDGGETPFATTEIDVIGKTLVALLSRGDAYQQSANTYVHVAGHVTTQLEIWKTLEKVTGEKFEVYTEVDATSHGKRVKQEIADGEWANALDLLKVVTFDKNQKLGIFPKYWNDLLGLPKPDMEQTIREVIEGKRKFIVSESY